MKYIVENSLREFPAWSGGKDTLEDLTLDEIEVIENFLNDMFEGRTPTATEINDFLWFERDDIAVILGFSDYEDLLENRKDE